MEVTNIDVTNVCLIILRFCNSISLSAYIPLTYSFFPLMRVVHVSVGV